MRGNDQELTTAFFPRGAIAFFVAMACFYLVFWFGMYALLLQRG